MKIEPTRTSRIMISRKIAAKIVVLRSKKCIQFKTLSWRKQSKTHIMHAFVYSNSETEALTSSRWVREAMETENPRI